MQWISVKDRLPELNENGVSEKVLCCLESKYIALYYLIKTKNDDYCPKCTPEDDEYEFLLNDTPECYASYTCGLEDLTHWMPLPKLPGEE